MLPKRRTGSSNSSVNGKSSASVVLPGTSYQKSPTSPVQRSANGFDSSVKGKATDKSPTSPVPRSANGFDSSVKSKITDNGKERQPVKKSDSFVNSRNVFLNGKPNKPVQKSESFNVEGRRPSASSAFKTETFGHRRPSATSAKFETPSQQKHSSVSEASVEQKRPSVSESVPEPRAKFSSLNGTNEDKDKKLRASSSSSESSVTTGVSATTSRSDYKFTSPEQSGYVGFANLPNQVHRKSVKKGFEFTLMVVGTTGEKKKPVNFWVKGQGHNFSKGESGLGKSTLVNSLFLTDLYPERHIHSAAEKITQTVKIDASTVEIEERGVKLRLTVVDTPGFGDSLNSQDCFKPIIQYIDSQFERYLEDESGLNRRHIIDNRVHCCFYFVNPSGHGLRPLDISFMKAVHHKVNIVPVIAKADTLTRQEVTQLKRKVMTQIAENGINLYPLPDCDEDEDEDYREQCRLLKEAVPFAVIGANTVIEVKGKKVRGRMYPWGVVEVENPDHCDFIKLRTMLITHMQDLQEVTQEVHYENYRAEKLAGGASLPKKTRRPRNEETAPEIVDKRRPDNPSPQELSEREKQLVEKEQELRRMQDMIAKMQAEMDHQKRNTPQKMHQNGEVKSQNV